MITFISQRTQKGTQKGTYFYGGMYAPWGGENILSNVLTF